jgi:hypothetical protein
MLSRKTWYVLAAVTLLFSVWLAFQPQSIVYSERELDGVLMQSKIDCGVGMAMVFANRFDASLPGASTQAECLRFGRTRVAEVFGLAVFAGILGYIGRRYGKEPPRPIRTELPELPKGEVGFEGKRRRTPQL